ncbi:hypothetical protein RFI_35823, partial [Reticulomyxa filosa]
DGGGGNNENGDNDNRDDNEEEDGGDNGSGNAGAHTNDPIASNGHSHVRSHHHHHHHHRKSVGVVDSDSISPCAHKSILPDKEPNLGKYGDWLKDREMYENLWKEWVSYRDVMTLPQYKKLVSLAQLPETTGMQIWQKL